MKESKINLFIPPNFYQLRTHCNHLHSIIHRYNCFVINLNYPLIYYTPYDTLDYRDSLTCVVGPSVIKTSIWITIININTKYKYKFKGNAFV